MREAEVKRRLAEQLQAEGFMNLSRLSPACRSHLDAAESFVLTYVGEDELWHQAPHEPLLRRINSLKEALSSIAS